MIFVIFVSLFFRYAIRKNERWQVWLRSLFALMEGFVVNRTVKIAPLTLLVLMWWIRGGLVG